MTREQVTEILRTYSYNAARCRHLECDIKILERRREHLYNDMVDDLASVKATVITDMPRGTGVGNPTERIGLLLASGYKTNDVQEVDKQIRREKEELESLRILMEYSDSWLYGLQDKEAFVVRETMMRGKTWREACELFAKEYGEVGIKETLKCMRKRAIDKICEIAV